MRRAVFSILFALTLLGAAPLSASADDQPKSFDGRLDDYGRNVTLDSGGTSLTYFIWAGLGVAAVIVMFKDAKRSHLD
jgi:hypothetical protein